VWGTIGGAMQGVMVRAGTVGTDFTVGAFGADVAIVGTCWIRWAPGRPCRQ